LYSLGNTDAQVAQILGVTEVTINEWKKDKEFSLALKKGKEFSDAKVEQSLYKRALGYEYTEVRTENIDIAVPGQEISVPATKVSRIVKEVVADVTACIFWLKNRKPDEWRDRHELDVNNTNTRKIIHELKGFDAATIRSIADGCRKGSSSERPLLTD